MWARELGRMSGVTIPLHACEHMYIVTQPIAGVTPDLPVLRDHDGHIYFKEEVGGLLMGGFDPWAKPWGTDRIPEPFIFQTLKEDWEKFEILMTNAVQRLPTLEHAEVRTFLNGPESFTPDNYFILGEAPEVRRYYVGAGFCSGGIAAAGGAGARARGVDRRGPARRWISGRRTSARFAPFHANPRFLRERVSEVRGRALQHCVPEPRADQRARGAPLASARAAAARAAPPSGPRWAGSAPTGSPPRASSPSRSTRSSRQNWFPYAAAEHRAAREAVALFDQTSFGKLLVQGPDAEALLQPLCANDVGGGAGPHRVHRHAERAGRLRERPHRDAPGPGRLSGGHRLRPAHARPRLDPPPHRRTARGSRSPT